jgi:peptide/nickel transport system permease protein
MLLKYITGRLVAALGLALAATLAVFLIAHAVPADPVLAMLGDRAASDPETVARFRAHWGFDRPLWQQYLIFLQSLVHGDLGESIVTRRPVLSDIAQFAPATVELATVAAFIAAIVGVSLGVFASIMRDSWIDHLARGVSLIGVAAPTFWLAFLALALFYGELEIAPSPGRLGMSDLPPITFTGLYTVDSLVAGDYDAFRSALAHLVMPGAVLAAATVGLITRTMRASMLDSLSQDYVRVARAKGLSETSVVIGHAIPNALIPVVTLGGLAYAELLTGTVLTETIFAWPGLGRYTFQSAVALDVPAILGITLIVALVYLVINIVVDISYAFLDPRVIRR